MPLTGNKTTSTPFKSMDIKAAFLASGSRKRKAPPQVCKDDTKNLKLDGSDLEIMEETCVSKAEPKSIEKKFEDCKENTDMNVVDGEHISLCNGNISLSEEMNKSIHDSKSLLDSESPTKNITDQSSSDELNSSPLNSSINVSCNASDKSIIVDDAVEEMSPNNLNSSKVSDKISANPQNSEKASKNQTSEKVKKRRRMTPEEAKKRAEEREKKQQEKDLKKQELEAKKRERLLEKERKQKERQLRKEQEELEKKEKERLKQEKKDQEEKERLQKLKEKEEKNKMRQILLEQKLEEKKKKEEMKQKREEELRKAEEEKKRVKLIKEQKEKEKQEKAKAAFVKFFVKGDGPSTTPVSQSVEKDGAFLPFQVSDDMILAPVVPVAAQERFNKERLDHFLEAQDGKELYLQILKSGSYQDVKLRKKQRKLNACEDDIILIDKNSQVELGLTAKLLQFSENVRPPYWGTWRKQSKNVRPRNPFGQDELFDYSVDSDEEWDEGGPGESLSGTEQEDESEDDYEVDNEFFVPHGYLSDEEKKEDVEENDPEQQKAHLKIMLQEFENERKKKTTELKPIILGCFFENDPKFQDSGVQKFLQAFAVEFVSEAPVPTRFSIKKLQVVSATSVTVEQTGSNNGNTVGRKGVKKYFVPEKAMPYLIRLVHGNTNKRSTLVIEFRKFWAEKMGCAPEESSERASEPIIAENASEQDLVVEKPLLDSATISKRQLNIAINEISVYGKPSNPAMKRWCWLVHDSILEKYGMTELPLPNQWNYVSGIESEETAVVKGSSSSIKEFLIP